MATEAREKMGGWVYSGGNQNRSYAEARRGATSNNSNSESTVSENTNSSTATSNTSSSKSTPSTTDVSSTNQSRDGSGERRNFRDLSLEEKHNELVRLSKSKTSFKQAVIESAAVSVGPFAFAVGMAIWLHVWPP